MTYDSQSNYWGRLGRQRVTRRSMLRASALAGVGATGLALVGCGDDDDDDQRAEPADPDRPQGGTLETFYNTGPTSLDGQGEILMLDFIGIIYSKLLKQVEGGIGTDLAVAMPETPDETTLVVEITPGVQFHDVAPTNGREVTAEDFVFSFDRLGTDEPRFQLKHLVASYSGFEATSPTTLTMRLVEPYSPAVTFLAHPNMIVVPRESVEAGGGDLQQGPLIGSGPFINTRIRANIEYLSERNPNYWREGLPYLDGHRTQIITEPAAALGAFRGGSLDLFEAADKEERETAVGSIPDVIQERIVGSTTNFKLNTQHELLADPRIRHAIHLGIDRDDVAGLLAGGDAVNYGFLPSFIPGSLGESVTGRAGWRADKEEDYAEARALLDAAGTPDPYEIPGFLGPTIGTLNDQAVVVSEQLKRIGIQATVQQVAFADWTPLIVTHDFTMSAGGTGVRLDPDEYFYNGAHSQGGRNDGNLNDPKVDALIEEQRRVFGDERIPIWQELEELMLELLPYVPLYVAFTTNLVQPGIEGLKRDGGRMAYYGHVYEQVSKEI